MSGTLLLVGLLVVGGLLCGTAMAIRLGDQRKRDRRRHVWRLHFPADLDASRVLDFLRALSVLPAARSGLSGADSIVFEVVAQAGRIEHRLRVPYLHQSFVSTQLRAALPGIVFEVLDGSETRVAVRLGRELRLPQSRKPLRTDTAESQVRSLLAAMQPLGSDERLLLQCVALPTAPPSPPAHATPQGPNRYGLVELAQRLSRPSTGEVVSEREYRAKRAESGFGVALRVGADAATNARANSLMGRLGRVVRLAERPGVPLVTRRLSAKRVATRVMRAATPLAEYPCYLNATELVALVAWPIATHGLPGLAQQQHRRLAAAESVPVSGRVLGDSDLPGTNRPVAINAADSLQHIHVLGPTGVGKSTLLGNLIAQDMAADRAVIVVDPKGDLIADVLERVPLHRQDDVILLDPCDDTRPVGFNLLEGAERSPELTSDLVVGIFHRLFAAFWGPRTADLLHASLLTLTHEPGMTLCELPLLFTNDSFRRQLLAHLMDPVLLSFWSWYEALSSGERAAALGPVMNKLRPLLLRRRIRHIIGQAEASWRIEDVLNRQGILLVNLAKGQVGPEAAALLGSLVVARLWQAIQVRTIRMPAMVVIDEFQDVLNLPTDLGDVLAQARGFGVGLTLAHQHLGQLDRSMRQAVAANARTKVSFQTAAGDGEAMAKILGGGLTASDLMRLPAFHAYFVACTNGAVQPPASVRTRPLSGSLGKGADVRVASRDRYGRDVAEVEAALAVRWQAEHANAPIGRTRRRREDS